MFMERIISYTCGFTGHKSNECRNKGKLWCKICKSNTHSDKACRKRNVNEHQHAKHMSDGTTRTFQFTLNNFESGAHGIPHNFLLVDTGATSHIVNDDSKFIFLDKHFNPETHFIELADVSKANNVALKKGTVEISLCDSFDNISVATLEDTLYVPSYPQNIFSVQAATAKGACVNFFSDSAQLVTKCGTKFNIERCGKLYYIQDSKSSSIQSSSIQSSSIQSSLLSTVCINHSRNI